MPKGKKNSVATDTTASVVATKTAAARKAAPRVAKKVAPEIEPESATAPESVTAPETHSEIATATETRNETAIETTNESAELNGEATSASGGATGEDIDLLAQIKLLEDQAAAIKQAEEKDKMSPREVFATVATWVVFAIALFALVFAIVARVGGDKTALFGHGFFSVRTESMEPEINVGDVVIGREFKSVSELVVDESDVLFYYELNGEKIIVIHRVIAISGNTVTTHGINNPFGANEIVDASAIIAVRTATLPGVGNILNFAASLPGFLLFIVLPILLLIGIEVMHIVQIIRGKGEYGEDSEGDESKKDESK